MLAPRWFFDTFPGFGLAWTAAYPPYNAHLMTDVGAAFTTIGVLLLIAAWLDDRRVTAVVLSGCWSFRPCTWSSTCVTTACCTAFDLGASLTSLAAGVLARPRCFS